MQKEKSDFPELENLRKEIYILNERLTKVEASLDMTKIQDIQQDKNEIIQSKEEFEFNLPFQSEGSIEFRVGEYGMAWLGNIVLFFGIAFLVGYLRSNGNFIFSTLIGFVSVAGIYVCSHYTRNSYSYLSKLFAYNAHLLLYFFTLRLHFFQNNPLIQNETLGLIILIAVTIALLYRALRKNSQLLTGIILILLVASGIFGNSTNVMAGIAAITALLAVILYYRYGWLKLTFVFIFLIYLAHLNWLLNNPLMGNSLEFIKSPGAGYLFFIATGFIFSILALIPKKEAISNEFIISSIIWNGLGFTFILALLIITYFQENYVPIFASITLFCLVFSIILKLRSFLKIIASMYVLYGFLALSLVIFGIYGLPKSYTFFAVQSLLVVSMALWFRSRFMVIMNTILFLAFMLFCLNDSVSHHTANFSFMLVAFISARVINWKKDRLNIKTEFVRNIYLVAGLLMTFTALYQACPESYITASWICVAVILFLLSLLIKNIKYSYSC